MRILLVSYLFPADPDRFVSGVYRRLGLFIEALRELGTLDMLFYVPSSVPVDEASVKGFHERLSAYWRCDMELTLFPQAPVPAPLSRWQAYGPGIVSLFGQTDYLCTSGREQVRAFQSALERKPDAIFAHRLQGMCPVLRTRGSLPPIYFDLDELHDPLEVTQEPTMMFIGELSYLPNANAAALLLDEIFPRVRRQVPDAKLVIAGPNPGALQRNRLPDPGIEFTGFVEDLAGLYRRSRVVCVPVRAGGGTRVKILEAATFAKPVVSTILGAEGLHVEDGRDILVRDGIEAFADACVHLLRDDDACRSLGLAAHATVSERYDRSSIVGAIRDELRATFT